MCCAWVKKLALFHAAFQVPTKPTVNFLSLRWPEFLPLTGPEQQDQLSAELIEYQTLEDREVVQEDRRIDEFWTDLSLKKDPVTRLTQFPLLAKVARLVLTLPHSNADAERVFSAIGLNKTKTRNRLQLLDGTLAAMMTVKMATQEPCYDYEPPEEIMKAAKSATHNAV